MRFGIIGGTGFYSIGGDSDERIVNTPYGQVAVHVTSLGDQDIAFIPRHGRDHVIPPHLVNYRANIAALKSLGVRRVLASAAVGSLNAIMQPGDFVLPVQFLDFTRARRSTFYDGAGEVRHIDVTTPYCPMLRDALQRVGAFLGGDLHPAAVYVCTEGPRFETPAEIEMFRRLGGDIVGMTGVPEAPLAREAGICYATVAVVVNWAAGLGEGRIEQRVVESRTAEQIATVRRLFEGVIESWQEQPCLTCAPQDADAA
jgi:5'-methylthioadenosine phosphorylase